MAASWQAHGACMAREQQWQPHRPGGTRLLNGEQRRSAVGILVAAARTVEGAEPHSLHGYFLIGGDPSAPIDYEVERMRDGRSFATRRTVAIQHGQPIFTLTSSCCRDT